MLAHVVGPPLGFEFWGVRTDDLRPPMARIVFWSVTGQKPPDLIPASERPADADRR